MSTTTTTAQDVDMNAAVRIQTKVSEYANAGYSIFANGDDHAAAPYAEGFYDNCILCWVEDGYDEAQVQETVDGAVKELRDVWSN